VVREQLPSTSFTVPSSESKSLRDFNWSLRMLSFCPAKQQANPPVENTKGEEFRLTASGRGLPSLKANKRRRPPAAQADQPILTFPTQTPLLRASPPAGEFFKNSKPGCIRGTGPVASPPRNLIFFSRLKSVPHPLGKNAEGSLRSSCNGFPQGGK